MARPGVAIADGEGVFRSMEKQSEDRCQRIRKDQRLFLLFWRLGLIDLRLLENGSCNAENGSCIAENENSNAENRSCNAENRSCNAENRNYNAEN
ncbi:hypothetical protein L3X38_036651 [Prunus dulcis]|uniref:Uncharacterized protein n=1 Tax=Prunus dulcis TaxID=3755 RepID=A0AAD4YPY4_PRUDU|nr:hypothetical protein L3X38_036651 [Prunus dulcis]